MNKETVSLPVQSDNLSGYYQEVRSFQIQRAMSSRRNSKILGAVAGISIVANLGLAWTIASLLPLTKIVPVYLWVRADGTVDNSVTLSRLPATSSDAVISSALWEYVRLREGYSYDSGRYSYDAVSGMSNTAVRAQYQGWFNYPNPQSPQVTVGQKGQIDIDHISTARLTASVMQIRYRRTVNLNGVKPVTTTWTATMQYQTVSALPAAARLENPGGVVITSYQSSEDSGL